MKVLLDTHAFLWLETNPRLLSSAAFSIINDLQNEVCLSYISLWEIQIKLAIGKLTSPISLEERVRLMRSKAKLTLLPLTIEHIYTVSRLPLHHRDPFDRMLIAQSIQEHLPMISNDAQFKTYPLRIIW